MKSDGNDFELTGETDDEDMEDRETGSDDGIRDPADCQRTPRTHEHTSTT